MTRFQKQVLIEYERHEQEQQQQNSPQPAGTLNSANPRVGGHVERVRYINEGEPDTDWEIID
jgi:hypothetical protein